MNEKTKRTWLKFFKYKGLEIIFLGLAALLIAGDVWALNNYPNIFVAAFCFVASAVFFSFMFYSMENFIGCFVILLYVVLMWAMIIGDIVLGLVLIVFWIIGNWLWAKATVNKEMKRKHKRKR